MTSTFLQKHVLQDFWNVHSSPGVVGCWGFDAWPCQVCCMIFLWPTSGQLRGLFKLQTLRQQIWDSLGAKGISHESWHACSKWSHSGRTHLVLQRIQLQLRQLGQALFYWVRENKSQQSLVRVRMMQSWTLKQNVGLDCWKGLCKQQIWTKHPSKGRAGTPNTNKSHLITVPFWMQING